MKLNPKFLTHETKGEHITVSTIGTKINGLIRSNPTAAFIVESLKKDTTESEIVDKMLAKYEVDRTTGSIFQLNGIEDEILNVLCADKAVRYVEAERAKAIASEVRKRIDALESIAVNHSSYDVSSRDGDVESNTAASYT